MCPSSSFWRFWQDATLSTSSPCCSSRSGSLDWRPGSSFSTLFSFRHFLLQTPSPSHPKPSLPPQRHLHDGLRLHDSCPCCRKVQNTLCFIIPYSISIIAFVIHSKYEEFRFRYLAVYRPLDYSRMATDASSHLRWKFSFFVKKSVFILSSE